MHRLCDALLASMCCHHNSGLELAFACTTLQLGEVSKYRLNEGTKRLPLK